MNGARGFAANRFYDARMSVAERVDGDAAEKIEILLASGVEDVGAAAVSQDHGLTLVSGQKKFFGIEQARVRFYGEQLRMLGLGRWSHRGFFLGRICALCRRESRMRGGKRLAQDARARNGRCGVICSYRRSVRREQ